jgi:N-methylhydantoinase B
MTRKALRAIPREPIGFVDYLDNDGIELDKPIRIEVAVTVKGGDIEFDFEGHQPAGQGAAQLRAVRLAGGGVLRRARAHRPHHPDQRRLLPADQAAPAEGHDRQSAGAGAVNARTSTIKRITGCMIGALAQILPERVPAASAGELLVLPSAAATEAAAATSSAS